MINMSFFVFTASTEKSICFRKRRSGDGSGDGGDDGNAGPVWKVNRTEPYRSRAGPRATGYMIISRNCGFLLRESHSPSLLIRGRQCASR